MSKGKLYEQLTSAWREIPASDILDEAKKDRENYNPTEDGWYEWFKKWFGEP